jgi:hypothetical protein
VGNAGVAALVRRTPGAIGYVELAYATKNGLSVATLRNRAGRDVRPDQGSLAAAARAPLPPSGVASLVDPSAADAYPIASFAYALVRRDHPAAEAVAAFLRWTLGDGQGTAAKLGHAPLPAAVAERASAQLARIGPAGPARSGLDRASIRARLDKALGEVLADSGVGELSPADAARLERARNEIADVVLRAGRDGEPRPAR